MEPKINIFEDLDGKKIVMIHDIRFKGKRKINWKEVESCYEIAETAEKIYIGTTLPDEFSWSDDSKRLQGTLAKAKANAAQGIQQLIEVASNKRYHAKDGKMYLYDMVNIKKRTEQTV